MSSSDSIHRGCMTSRQLITSLAYVPVCLEGIDAVPCYGYHVSYLKEPVDIPYPEISNKIGVRPEGRSFRHGRFVQNLRKAAIDTPNVTVVEAKVTDVLRDESIGKVVGVMATRGVEKEKIYVSVVSWLL